MLVKRVDDVPAHEVAVPGAQGVRMRLLMGRADGAPTFAMRLFEVAPGGHTPLHQHNYEHEVLVLEGRGELRTGSDPGSGRGIGAGDVVLVPGNQMHQFQAAPESGLRFICLVPVSYDCAGQRAATPGS